MEDNKTNAPEKGAGRTAVSPLKVFINGDISASVFAREGAFRGEKRMFYSYTLSRSYRDKNGVYQYTKSFNPGDGPDTWKSIQQAEECIANLMLADK